MSGRWRAVVVTAVVISGAGALPAGAQSCTTANNALSTSRTCSVTATTNAPAGSWVVNKLGQMTLSSVSTLTLTSPTSTAYDANTLQEASGNSRSVTVLANAPWTVTVSPNTAGTPSYWTAANDATYGAFVAAETTKPSTDFQVSLTQGSGYLSLPANNTGATTLLANQPATAGQTFNVYFATTWFYQFDTPGTYTLPFVFALTIP